MTIERPSARYTLQSFDFIGNVVDDPSSLAVLADSPIRTLGELVAWAKANPGAATTGTPGVGTPGHILITLLQKATGAPFTHVPFKGAGEVKGAMAGKQIALSAVSVGEAMQAIKGGTPLRILAQASATRSTRTTFIASAP